MKNALGRGFKWSHCKEEREDEQQTKPHCRAFPSSQDIDKEIVENHGSCNSLAPTTLTEVQPHLKHIERGSYARGGALRFLHKIATNQRRSRFTTSR